MNAVNASVNASVNATRVARRSVRGTRRPDCLSDRHWPPLIASDCVPHQVPGVLIGSYTVGRAASEPGSWQSTRTLLDNEKKSKKKGGGFFG